MVGEIAIPQLRERRQHPTPIGRYTNSNSNARD